MNSIKGNMKKKMITLVLAGAVTASLFTACGNNTAQTETGGDAGTTEQETEQRKEDR